MSNVSRLAIEGNELLKEFVEKMGLEGAIIATSEGLEMASYFKNNVDSDLVAADTASLLSVLHGTLENIGKSGFQEMIINSEEGSIAIKDLGDEVSFACITPKGYKMGGLVVALKQFIKDLNN